MRKELWQELIETSICLTLRPVGVMIHMVSILLTLIAVSLFLNNLILAYISNQEKTNDKHPGGE